MPPCAFDDSLDFSWGDTVWFAFVLLCNRSMSCSSWTTVLRSIEEAQTSMVDSTEANVDSNGARTGAAANSKSFGAENQALPAATSNKLSNLRLRAPLTPRTNSSYNAHGTVAGT